MFTILQNFTGQFSDLGRISAPAHSAYAKRHGYGLEITDVAPPDGMIYNWSKVICILKWLGVSSPGDRAVWIDGDALIVSGEEMHNALDPDCDIGMCMIETHNAEFHNSGVIFLSNTDKCRELFGEVLKFGPFKTQTEGYFGCPYLGDQGRINSLLKPLGISVTNLPSKYNSYMLNPCDNPIIMAWHGLPVEECGKKMLSTIESILPDFRFKREGSMQCRS